MKKSRIIFNNILIFEPKFPVKISSYKCDNKFHIEEIILMYDNYDINGIVYTDGEECIFYELKSKYFKKILSCSIYLQNQFKAGGQSANRLSRNRDIQRYEYVSLMAERTVELFYDKNSNISKIKNLIFCGRAQFKNEIKDHKIIKSFFNNINVNAVTMDDLNFNIILEYIDNLNDPLEMQHINNIQYLLRMNSDKLLFGEEIISAILHFELETIYVSNNSDKLKEIKDIMKKNNIDYSINVIMIKSNFLEIYDNIIGVKFY